MMKKILTFTSITLLTSIVMAGGDDRDFGPVETLDSVQITSPTPETGFFSNFLSDIGLESMIPPVAPAPAAVPAAVSAVEKTVKALTPAKISANTEIDELMSDKPTPTAPKISQAEADFLDEIGVEPVPSSAPAPIYTPKPVSVPVMEKAVIIEKAPETMILTKVNAEIVKPHESCQTAFNLSDNNIDKFEEALEGGFLFSTGPIDTSGTLFSPKRWADYFACVKQ